MGAVIYKVILCLLPLLMTPVWGYLIAEGYLNFGGGEKDLFLLVPWIVWSFIYLLGFIFLWVKGKETKTIVKYSTGAATAILLLAWIILFIWFNNILGVKKG